MQIKVETLSKVKKRIDFEIPAVRVNTEIEKVYGEIRKNAAIKGFRKGKVPQAVIEKHFSDRMEADVLKNLVNDTYFKALMEQKIFPVSHPVIESDDLKKGEPFKYSATVEVLPEIEVRDFVGLELKKEEYVYDEEVINRRIKEMQENMAQLRPVEDTRPAHTGDFVTLDFKGFFGDVPFENGSAEDYQLELGSGRFIPGFEEQVVGMQVGDEKRISAIFPDDYGNKELAGKEATFHVKVKEIKVKELPPLDSDFAKEFGEFETIEQLTEKLKEVYEKQEHDRIDADLRERVVKALIAKNDLEIPEALVEKQLEVMLENSKKRLAYQKLSLEMMGLDEERYKSQFRSVAESQVKGSLLLDALAKHEGIKVEEADIDAKILQIAEQNNQDVEAIKKYYQHNENARESLVIQIGEDKAINLLLSKATISEVPRAEL